MKKGKEVVERPVHQFTREIGVTPAPTRAAGRQGCISRVNNSHEGGRTHRLPRRASNARVSATSAAFDCGWWAPPNILGFFLGVDDRRVSPTRRGSTPPSSSASPTLHSTTVSTTM
ncbi:hypothetical protein An11g00020 [Aspergillus niger]|uniref:Uncharacterized protein n=2 Tax=Aspergillus niger TaxID=5061 RepID=A5ABD7_ASPNC|nr:hypothetical protein An11g00020 [Aspergillus niger]CAK48235.1 hypothetical protein An11g00020 [Aspergillus niger]